MNKPVAWINLEAWESGKYPPDDCFSDEEFTGSIPLYTHPVKELTNEKIDQTIKDCGYEIEETVMGKFVDIEGINMYNSLCGFAKAILRKAQEK